MSKRQLSADQKSFLHKIANQIQSGLPGEDAQNLMSPVESHASYRNIPHNHKIACVMGLIYPQDGELYIAYIERTSKHPGDKHAGQISFPGGKMEAEDADFLACAKREVQEEIGIRTDMIHNLGQLTDLYVFASNFMVYPFLGYLEESPTFIAQESEVASIISFSIQRLIEDDILDKIDISVRKMILKDVPYYKLENHILWGATAMITSEIVAIIKDVDCKI